MKRRLVLALGLLPAFLCFSCYQGKPGIYRIDGIKLPFSNEANRREFPFYAEIYNAIASSSGGAVPTIDPSFPEEEDYLLPVPVEEEETLYSLYYSEEEDLERGNRYSQYDWDVYGGAFSSITFEENSPAPSSHFAGKTVSLLLARVSEQALPLHTNFFVILTDGDSIFGFPAHNTAIQPPIDEWTAEEGCLLASGFAGQSGERLTPPYGPWRWSLEWSKDEIINHGFGMYATPKAGYEQYGYSPTPAFLESAHLVDDVISDGNKNPISYVTLEEPYHIAATTGYFGTSEQ